MGWSFRHYLAGFLLFHMGLDRGPFFPSGRILLPTSLEHDKAGDELMGQFTAGERLLFLISWSVALLAIVVGYIFKNTGTEILKDFMVFGSGAGIAYILARAGARATTSERVRSLCNRSVQRLGLTASQTRNASSLILREIPNQASTEVVAALLDSVAEQAEVSIGDLEEMAGAKIVLDELVSDALHSIKAAAEGLPETSSAVKEKILASVKEMVAAAATPGKAALAATAFSCPQCGKLLSAILREPFGSTAHARCPECLSQVIVHRTRDGGTFAKIYSVPRGGILGSAPLGAKQAGSILCPHCKRPIFVNIKPESTSPVIRNCFHCDERIYLDAATGAVIRSEHGEPLSAIYTMEGVKAVITCPSCSNVLRIPNLSEHDVFKASCPKCTVLIHGKRADKNEPQIQAPGAVAHTAST